MRRKILFLLLLICFLFASCTQISDNTADYIRMNSWKNTYKNGTSVSLKFDENDCAKFKVVSKDKKAGVTINGLCIMDKKTLMISDKKTEENFIFTYNVTGNKLTLKDENSTLKLKIVEKKSE